MAATLSPRPSKNEQATRPPISYGVVSLFGESPVFAPNSFGIPLFLVLPSCSNR